MLNEAQVRFWPIQHIAFCRLILIFEVGIGSGGLFETEAARSIEADLRRKSLRILPILLPGLIGLIAAPAQAALTIMLEFPKATFTNDSVYCAETVPCVFKDTVTFATQSPTILDSATISTFTEGGSGSTSDIDLTAVALDGMAFSLTKLLYGVFEIGGLSQLTFAEPGNHTLVVIGISYGAGSEMEGGYKGELNFSPRPFTQDAIPEPATWLFTLSGLGLTGMHLRRRKAGLHFA
jgi:hypothetical protein